jgi:hypothetical protein
MNRIIWFGNNPRNYEDNIYCNENEPFEIYLEVQYITYNIAPYQLLIYSYGNYDCAKDFY